MTDITKIVQEAEITPSELLAYFDGLAGIICDCHAMKGHSKHCAAIGYQQALGGLRQLISLIPKEDK